MTEADLLNANPYLRNTLSAEYPELVPTTWRPMSYAWIAPSEQYARGLLTQGEIWDDSTVYLRPTLMVVTPGVEKDAPRLPLLQTWST